MAKTKSHFEGFDRKKWLKKQGIKVKNLPDWPPLANAEMGFPEPFAALSKEQVEKFAGNIYTLIHRTSAMEHFRAMVCQWEVKDCANDILSFPLPERKLTLSEKYTVLAAIHDRCKVGMKINPWQKSANDSKNQLIKAVCYEALCASVLRKKHNGENSYDGIPVYQKDRLSDILAEVTKDVKITFGEPTTTNRKHRGRPKADYETIQRETKLVATWQRARDSGDYKADFAKDKGMNLKVFNRLLNRVARRKSRSDK